MTLSIDRLDCQYRASRRGESSASVRARLDRLAVFALPSALRNRTEPLPVDDGALCFLERVEIETRVAGAASEQQIAERWAASLWTSLAKRFRDRDGVVVFASRAEYLAAFLIEQLAAPAEPTWYFAPLLESGTAVSALLDDPDAGREALIAIHRGGHLHALLQRFVERELEEIVQRCLAPHSPDVMSGTTLQRWTDAIRGVRASARFVPSGRRAHDAIVLYLETLAAHPDLGPDANLARWIVRLLDLAARCEREPTLIDALRDGDFIAARPLLDSPAQARWAGSMLQAVAPREVAVLVVAAQANAAGAIERTLYTDYAGVFLLASSVIALELTTLPPLSLFLAAVHCLGDEPAARADPGVAVFAGLPAPPSPDVLVAAEASGAPAALGRRIAASIVGHFAIRLGAFSDSSPAYLLANFFRGRGVVTIAADRVSVRFLTCPMRVVLRMAGFGSATVAMEWNECRRLELDLE